MNEVTIESHKAARAIRLSPEDDVAILVDSAERGEVALGIIALDAVPAGHKMAMHDLAAGSTVRRYGQVIGVATQAIRAGEHVHTHNLVATKSSPGSRPELGQAAIQSSPPRRGDRFAGYVRADGRVGTRNCIGIIASVNCSATVVRRIARRFEENLPQGVDAVVPITHSSGCGMAANSEGAELLERTLAGYARHPNFSSVLVIGLGCEVIQVDRILDRYLLKESDQLRRLTIQEEGGTAEAIERGSEIVREMVIRASTERRTPCPASELVLGLQCGGSDGWSGVSANPALGIAADHLVAEGGTVLLSETPEIYGAEHLLLSRAASPAVAEALRERIVWWEDYAAKNGVSLDNNPSPGNKAGGLTTILEKSLGAVAKSGSSPLRAVIGYAEPADRKGLLFMDSPGYDPCSATGQIASGANILAFTTGRGSVFGSRPTPCLKIASNSRLAQTMIDDIDVDASPVLSGTPLAEVGETIYQALLAMASGTLSKSEQVGMGDFEFVPWQLGAFL